MSPRYVTLTRLQQAILAPGDKEGVRANGVLRIGREDATLVESGKKQLWIYAQADYFDVFGGRYTSGYCRIYVPEINMLGYLGRRSFQL